MVIVDHSKAQEFNRKLARTINAYWSNQGYIVAAEPYCYTIDENNKSVWSVTSKLVNGLPRGYKNKGHAKRLYNGDWFDE